jgi:hypothetical protein
MPAGWIEISLKTVGPVERRLLHTSPPPPPSIFLSSKRRRARCCLKQDDIRYVTANAALGLASPNVSWHHPISLNKFYKFRLIALKAIK